MAQAVYKSWVDLRQKALNFLPQGLHQWLHVFDGEALTERDLASLAQLIDAYVSGAINHETFTTQFESVFVRANKPK